MEITICFLYNKKMWRVSYRKKNEEMQRWEIQLMKKMIKIVKYWILKKRKEGKGKYKCKEI